MHIIHIVYLKIWLGWGAHYDTDKIPLFFVMYDL